MPALSAIAVDPSIPLNAVRTEEARWLRFPFSSSSAPSGKAAPPIGRWVLSQAASRPDLACQLVVRALAHIMGAWGKTGDGVFAGDVRDVKWLNHLFDELTWWSNALKAAREGRGALAM